MSERQQCETCFHFRPSLRIKDTGYCKILPKPQNKSELTVRKIDQWCSDYKGK